MVTSRTRYVPTVISLILISGWLVGECSAQVIDFVYDSATGSLLIDTPDDVGIRTFRIGAKEPIFQVDRPDFLTHVHPPEYEIRFGNGDYRDLAIDSILQPGLDTEYLLNNLCAYGISTDRGELRGMSVNGQGVVPENGCGPPQNATGTVSDATVVLSYSAETGHLSYMTDGVTSTGDAALVTTLEMISSSSIFTGDPVPGLDRQFEVDRDDKLFLLRPEGEASRDFGNAVATGLSHTEFTNDVCVDGSWAGGGHISAEYQLPTGSRIPFSCNVDPNTSGPASDVEVAYLPSSGELTVSISGVEGDAAAAAVGRDLFTSVQVNSAAGLFVPENGINLGLTHDQITTERIVKQTESGFDELFLGAVLPKGLTAEQIAADITVDGTTLLGSRLESTNFVVPEPTACWPLCLALLAMRRHRRRTSR